LRKNFQINAVVFKSNAINQPATTLELQQDRQVDRGNKWGAWFRYDLEIHPGAAFNWNGAIHTEGNVFFGTNNFRAYLISSPSSCLYGQNGMDASEISVTRQVDQSNNPTFLGQIVSGAIQENSFISPTATIDTSQSSSSQLTVATDSVIDSGTISAQLNPTTIAIDPLLLFTANQSQSRNQSDPSNTINRDKNGWDNNSNNPFTLGSTSGRISNKQEPTPYVDDMYRADDRYGPKVPPGGFLPGKKVGDTITSTDPNYLQLVNNNPPTDNPEQMGLDGYWERRARASGLRLIVGQRLELGNAFGWNGPSDPLYPPNATNSHEQQQRRTLRDNLAAVQATAVYHYKDTSGGYFPMACLATTAHPGTATTLQQSTNFQVSDFFTGKGTNGWEYAPPATNENAFANAIASNLPLRRALSNLAYFAGDPYGAFPPKQEMLGSTVHPYPYLTAWGDFSNLRRVINELDGGVSYYNLSIADKTSLHTAACTLGMLANNISNVVSNPATNLTRDTLQRQGSSHC